VIARFLNCLILVSRIFFSSNMIFLSSLSSGKIVWTGILLMITLFKEETWKTRCTREDGGNSNV
jgi:hypothetical protein